MGCATRELRITNATPALRTIWGPLGWTKEFSSGKNENINKVSQRHFLKFFFDLLLSGCLSLTSYSLSVWKVGTSKLNSKIYSSHEALCIWKIMSVWRVRSRFYSKCRRIDKEKQNWFSRTFLATVSRLVEQLDI